MTERGHPSAAPILGIIAEFNSPERLIVAAKLLKDAGFNQIEAFTPMPLGELDDLIGAERQIIPGLTLAGALIGAASAFVFMTWTLLVDYPINIGGRPLFNWPAYIPITFEMAVLAGCYTAGISLLLLSRLPRLHHPLFEVPGFERASQDRFFLMLKRDDPAFEAARIQGLFERANALRVAEVPCS